MGISSSRTGASRRRSEKKLSNKKIYLETEIDAKSAVKSFSINEDDSRTVRAHELASVLEDEQKRNLFLNFLRSIATAEQFKYLKVSYSMLQLNNDDLAHMANFFVAFYKNEILPTLTKKSNENFLLDDISNLIASNDYIGNNDEFMKSIKESIKDCVIILAMSFFPRFIRSNYFLRDCHNNNDNNNNNMNENESNIMSKKCTQVYSFHDSSYCEKTLSYSTDDYIQQSFHLLDHKAISNILQESYWMKSLYRTLENLPFCITISEVINRKHFPIIYVNTAYEMMTGFQRHEVICRNILTVLLQETNSTLYNALSAAKSDRILLLNTKQNGESFKNYLLLKPIFDVAGVYRYVICIHINASISTCCAMEFIMAEHFITMFPNTVFINM